MRMKNFVLFFLLVLNTSLCPAQGKVISLPLKRADQAVWKIQSPAGTGTAFFINKNHLITNFHLAKVQNPSHIRLLQPQNNIPHLKIMKITNVVALSALYDLALLKTKTQTSHYLSVRQKPLLSDTPLILLAYPQGVFKKTKNHIHLIYETGSSYSLGVSDPVLYGGISGSPVLDEKGSVAGVSSNGHQYVLDTIKARHLNKFIHGQVGSPCKGSLTECVDTEINKLKKFAKMGISYAQYMLALEYLYENKFDRALRWFKKAHHLPQAQYNLAVFLKSRNKQFESMEWMSRAAHQGDPEAQYHLAMMHLREKTVSVKPNLKEAFFWMRKAALQGYPQAQYRLSLMYYEGKGTESNLHQAILWMRKIVLHRSQYYMAARYHLETFQKLCWQVWL